MVRFVSPAAFWFGASCQYCGEPWLIIATQFHVVARLVLHRKNILHADTSVGEPCVARCLAIG